MKRQIRRKLIIQQLEKKLDTYERRIRQMSENHYKIRQFLETLTKQENDDAIHQNDSEGSTGSGSVDNGTGGAELLIVENNEAVLEEQPAELPSN